jgi:hypothetical protein
VVGRFKSDRRDGKWTWYDGSGRKQLEGDYTEGHKEGMWRQTQGPGGESAVQRFVHGQQVDDLDGLLARLSEDLLSDERRRQVQAAAGLQALGRAGVPALRAAVRDGETGRQLIAIRTLQHLGRPAAAAAEDLEAAAKDATPRVRFRALVALAEVEPKRARDAFAVVLAVAADDDGHQQQETALQSAAHAGPIGLRQLVAALNGERPEVRVAAFEVVRRMRVDRLLRSEGRGDPRVDGQILAHILSYLRDHFDEEIRSLAAAVRLP